MLEIDCLGKWPPSLELEFADSDTLLREIGLYNVRIISWT